MTNSTTTIVGNVTRNPHMTYTSSGKAVCNFTVAINEDNKPVTFMPVAVFGKQAEHCMGSLIKGTRVVVVGRTDVNRWTDSDGTGRQQSQLFAAHVGVSLQFTTAKANPRQTTTTEGDCEAARVAGSLGMEWDEGEMRWKQIRPVRAAS
jgi:single-strand DNA-binding protein